MKFNKDYLILEDLNPNLTNLINTNIGFLECDILVFNETTRILNQKLKKHKQSTTENTNYQELTKVSKDDVLTNKVSMDIILENIATIKKPTVDKQEVKKLT